MFKVTNSNRKLGTIVAINLPAGCTCRPDAPCQKECYAKKGNFMFANVKNCYQENLDTFLNNPEQAKKDILEQLPYIGYCRIHASGDFVNKEYFEMIVDIAKQCKRVKFMAFTKKYELVNEYVANGGKIPSNLKIIFSAWFTSDWTFDNPYKFPVSYVYDKKINNPIPKKAIPCGGQCDKCFMCWELKKGQAVRFDKH